MNNKPTKSKDDFIYLLSHMTPQEINKIIEENNSYLIVHQF